MTLTGPEFLRRFLQHVLPKGFPRIRYFGWLANRKRGPLLQLCRVLLAQTTELAPTTSMPDQPVVQECPKCHGPMRIVERFTLNRLLFPLGPQSPSSSIPLNPHFNTAPFHAFWRVLWTCAFIYNQMFFAHSERIRTLLMYRSGIAANINFGSTSAWSLPRPANSAIQSP